MWIRIKSKSGCRKKILVLLLFFLTTVSSLSEALYPDSESIQQGVVFSEAARNSYNILMPVDDYAPCLNRYRNLAKMEYEICALETGVSQGWEFLTTELEYLTNLELDKENFLPVSYEFFERLHRAIMRNEDSKLVEGNVIPIDMDRMNEDRIDDLAATYDLVLKGNIQRKRLFIGSVYRVGELDGVGVPIDRSSMKSLVRGHISDKAKGTRCSRKASNNVSHSTLGDLFRFSKYLEKGRKRFPDDFPEEKSLQMRHYSPVVCCYGEEDLFSCVNSANDAKSFEGPVISKNNSFGPFLFHHLIDPSYLKATLGRFNTALMKANNTEDLLAVVADFVRQLVLIHPYADGNGRTIRLFADYVLMLYGLAPIALDSFSPVPWTRKEWRPIFIGGQKEGNNIMRMRIGDRSEL